MYSDKDRLRAIKGITEKMRNDSQVIFPDTRLKYYADEIFLLATESQRFLEANKDTFPTLKKENNK